MTTPDKSDSISNAARARLRVVGAEAPTTAARRSRSFWIACLLAVAVLGLWLALGSTLATVRALEAENTALVADLAQTREALAAHRARLDAARARVGELRERIGSLDALLATDPAAPAPGRPAPAPSEP